MLSAWPKYHLGVSPAHAGPCPGLEPGGILQRPRKSAKQPPNLSTTPEISEIQGASHFVDGRATCADTAAMRSARERRTPGFCSQCAEREFGSGSWLLASQRRLGRREGGRDEVAVRSCGCAGARGPCRRGADPAVRPSGRTRQTGLRGQVRVEQRRLPLKQVANEPAQSLASAHWAGQEPAFSSSRGSRPHSLQISDSSVAPGLPLLRVERGLRVAELDVYGGERACAQPLIDAGA
jgi:hypothetical protein